MSTEQEIYQAYANVVRYCEETGKMFWREFIPVKVGRRSCKKRVAGEEITTRNTRYLIVSYAGAGKGSVHQHKLAYYILYKELPEVVDHKDRDSLNNKPANLRAATIQQNNRNKSKANKTEEFSSQYKGVKKYGLLPSGNARSNPFQVTIHIKKNGHGTSVGWFNNELDAAKAYDKAALEYFRGFAATNF